ncbi:MAG: PQQ-dependent sugar dehydrogenase, partial [Dehalococcoidia bacterium]
MTPARRLPAVLSLLVPPAGLAVVLLAVACTGGEEAAPAAPAATVASTSVASTSVASPSPSPAARAATATATATPAPAPSVVATAATRSTPAPTPTGAAAPRIALEPAFGQTFFERPVDLGPYPGGRVFVAEQDGRVLLLTPGQEGSSVLLDLSGRVLRSGNEEGLLSVALDPDFASNGFVYAYYSAGGPRRSVLG